jgi:phospholipid/cholesterol/gamma-HCH transport system substrate-binding protein
VNDKTKHGGRNDSLPTLLQAKIVQSLENAGFLQAIVRPAPDVAADYQLLLDIRSFQLVLSPEPRADGICRKLEV